MIHRANFTKRQRISRSSAHITLYEMKGKPTTFDADLRLGTYKIPASSLVFVEAYRQTLWMRFNFGTVGTIVVPEDRQLTQFDSIEAILFRVKVTSAEQPHGILLAECDRIPFSRPQQKEDKRISLLSVKPEELGDQVFRLDFTDEPLLLINSEVGDWQAFSCSPAFISLALPTLFREILKKILLIDEHDDTEDESDWRSRWLRFATQLPGSGDQPERGDRDHINQWIEDVISSFCRKHKLMEQCTMFWKEETIK